MSETFKVVLDNGKTADIPADKLDEFKKDLPLIGRTIRTINRFDEAPTIIEKAWDFAKGAAKGAGEAATTAVGEFEDTMTGGWAEPARAVISKGLNTVAGALSSQSASPEELPEKSLPEPEMSMEPDRPGPFNLPGGPSVPMARNTATLPDLNPMPRLRRAAAASPSIEQYIKQERALHSRNPIAGFMGSMAGYASKYNPLNMAGTAAGAAMPLIKNTAPMLRQMAGSAGTALVGGEAMTAADAVSRDLANRAVNSQTGKPQLTLGQSAKNVANQMTIAAPISAGTGALVPAAGAMVRRLRGVSPISGPLNIIEKAAGGGEGSRPSTSLVGGIKLPEEIAENVGKGSDKAVNYAVGKVLPTAQREAQNTYYNAKWDKETFAALRKREKQDAIKTAERYYREPEGMEQVEMTPLQEKLGELISRGKRLSQGGEEVPLPFKDPKRLEKELEKTYDVDATKPITMYDARGKAMSVGQTPVVTTGKVNAQQLDNTIKAVEDLIKWEAKNPTGKESEYRDALSSLFKMRDTYQGNTVTGGIPWSDYKRAQSAQITSNEAREELLQKALKEAEARNTPGSEYSVEKELAGFGGMKQGETLKEAAMRKRLRAISGPQMDRLLDEIAATREYYKLKEKTTPFGFRAPKDLNNMGGPTGYSGAAVKLRLDPIFRTISAENPETVRNLAYPFALQYGLAGGRTAGMLDRNKR